MVRPTPDQPRPVVGHPPLTDREYEAAELLTRTGWTRKKAAASLGISTSLLSRRLKAAMAKTGTDHIGALGRALGRAEGSD